MGSNKESLLNEFISKFKHLPAQRSKQWLEDRKYSIGGSEMGVIAGVNPYKNIRELIEGHLGMTSFTGNINTYWGSIIEDLVTKLLEEKWNCKIHETGSLPGSIKYQKYSPDGLVYLDFMDKIALIEIKSAARRTVNGRIPAMYKPQVYTGLDTVPIADIGLFVDAMFRRCSIDAFNFSSKYDTVIHPDKPHGNPLALCAIYIYEELYSTHYDGIKTKYDKKENEWIDAGSVDLDDLELLLGDTASGRLKFGMSSFVDDPDTIKEGIDSIFEDFGTLVRDNDYVPIAIMPLKLFKVDIIPVTREDWKKKYNRKTRSWVMPENPPDTTFVQFHQDTINTVIHQIMELSEMSPDEQIDKLDILYPPKHDIGKDLVDSLVSSLLF